MAIILRKKAPARTLAQAAAELARAESERITLGDVLAVMGERGPGAVLLALTLPNVTVMPSLPLLPLILGLPAMALCLRVAMGWADEPLSGWLASLSIKRTTAVRLVKSAAWLTGWARPRLAAVAEGTGQRASMVLAMILTLAMCLPLPGLNILPGLGLIVLAAGLCEADGIFVLIGAVLGLAGLVAAAMATSMAMNMMDVSALG